MSTSNISGRRIEVQYKSLLSISRWIETQYSRLSLILSCITILYCWCLPLFLSSLFLRRHARFSVSLVCVGDPDTSVFPEVLSRDSLSKSVRWRSESMENSRSTGRHPSAYLDFSRGMKVNEFADLTTSEFCVRVHWV